MRWGGFDPNLRRLVDWDLIIKYCSENTPVFIPDSLLDYHSGDSPDRISRRESELMARTYINRKHNIVDTASTVIVSYNQENYIRQAIESAIEQQGSFQHEIIMCDDGSTDSTPLIIQEYCKKYPKLIRSESRSRNIGISGNYRHAFASAQGEFISILEGDDYWIDAKKIQKKINFMRENPDCPMVFSGLELHNTITGEKRILDRQKRIKSNRLTARDFIIAPAMNLIVNLSTCMFRAEAIKNVPAELYEGRLSEIALAFYLDTIGPLGFLSEVMSVYRQHHDGAWAGASPADRLKSQILVRRVAQSVARMEYRSDIQRIIDNITAQLHGLQRA